jgi:preprotein translocase subunit SecY
LGETLSASKAKNQQNAFQVLLYYIIKHIMAINLSLLWTTLSYEKRTASDDIRKHFRIIAGFGHARLCAAKQCGVDRRQ